MSHSPRTLTLYAVPDVRLMSVIVGTETVTTETLARLSSAGGG